MSGVGYLTTEQDWNDILDQSKDLASLRGKIAQWQPYVDDAAQVIEGMTEADFLVWRKGLAKERRGRFSGVQFAERFGTLLMPASLMKGSMVAMHFGVPLGCALIRIRETAMKGRGMTTTSQITAIGDEHIQEYPPRERSGIIDYRIGKISVSYRGGENYRCGTCEWPDNYRTAEKQKCCARIKRIVQYREDHVT